MCVYKQKDCQKRMEKSLSLDSQVMETPVKLVANLLHVLPIKTN